jgi:methyl coenzyme M reductase beta subunit
MVRTTVNLDDDVLLAVQKRARREGRGVGEVLSELVRRALTDGLVNQREVGRHGFHPLPQRGRPVSNALINRLRGNGLD